MATLTFYGAAQEVTGSCYLLESLALGHILIDCGMRQGGNAMHHALSDPFKFDVAKIEAVVLSHAHLDHSGLLPQLVHEGFNGPIHCTEATADLLDVMLNDAAGLYERDLEHENLHRKRKGQKSLKPAYLKSDVSKVLKLCKRHAYQQTGALSAKATVRFHDAGHILGSSIVEMTLQEKGQHKTLVHSGDLGKKDSALMNNPATLSHADLVLMEGTYGNRNHRNMDETIDQLREILKTSWHKGGNVMIPAFAVGRTQEILFYLGDLYHRGELNDWQIFLDSPMAIAVTKIYDRWLHQLDQKDMRQLDNSQRQSLQHFLPTLKLAITPDESMAINKIKSGVIIIAGSGMCTGGRIQHHFKQRIWKQNNHIIFIGFQARNTLGRQLVDGAKHIKLFSEEYIVKATIETLGGFSAHAGQSELIDWISHFQNKPRTMLIHGEPEALDALAEKLWSDKNIRTEIPRIGQCIAF